MELEGKKTGWQEDDVASGRAAKVRRERPRQGQAFVVGAVIGPRRFVIQKIEAAGEDGITECASGNAHGTRTIECDPYGSRSAVAA